MSTSARSGCVCPFLKFQTAKCAKHRRLAMDGLGIAYHSKSHESRQMEGGWHVTPFALFTCTSTEAHKFTFLGYSCNLSFFQCDKIATKKKKCTAKMYAVLE